MDSTTYSHPEVESLVRDRFITIRVDADRRPDLNERYNLGGWPTTAFLTSGGETLSGTTYLDPTQMIAALQQVADAYRDRTAEISARSARFQADRGARCPPRDTVVDPHSAIARFRALLVERFDARNGGFGSAPKLPHAHALSFAISAGADGDSELATMSAVTLQRMRPLWDAASGGFFRYADGSDWSRPGTGKTIDDNALLLHAYVDAAVRLRDVEWLEQAAAIVRWTKEMMADAAHGGFFNAQSSHDVDRSMYVDKNAMMVGAFIRAAALFDDVWLRDFALKSLEAVIVPAYTPGRGMAHLIGANGHHEVRGLLTDQIHVAAALVWAHAATGQLPYSMLAAEIVHFAIRSMWDEASGSFRDRIAEDDPVMPFALNCEAACVLDRLSVLTGDIAYQERARAILQSLAADYLEQDIFGAPYVLAVREIFDRQPPPGLELSPVDWELGRT
jgi:uncharacterized protein YyaL (SSP411 family)